MTALGDIVFMIAQIRPALQNIPRLFQICPIEMSMIRPIAVRMFPLKGILRL
jgi:hypothetical protein